MKFGAKVKHFVLDSPTGAIQMFKKRPRKFILCFIIGQNQTVNPCILTQASADTISSFVGCFSGKVFFKLSAAYFEPA